MPDIAVKRYVPLEVLAKLLKITPRKIVRKPKDLVYTVG
jgi:hypothetical protein